MVCHPPPVDALHDGFPGAVGMARTPRALFQGAPAKWRPGQVRSGRVLYSLLCHCCGFGLISIVQCDGFLETNNSSKIGEFAELIKFCGEDRLSGE